MDVNPHIVIRLPEELTEEEIYFCLINAPGRRRELFNAAYKKRLTTWESVFAVHPSIPYPILFTPFLTDQKLMDEINARLDRLLFPFS